MAGVIFNVATGEANESGGAFMTVGPTMVCWSILGVWTLKRMAGIYTVQQRHVAFLRVHMLRLRGQEVRYRIDAEEPVTSELLKEIIRCLDQEIDVPQVCGIAVTPRSFQLVQGYVVAGLGSLVGGQAASFFGGGDESTSLSG